MKNVLLGALQIAAVNFYAFPFFRDVESALLRFSCELAKSPGKTSQEAPVSFKGQ